MKQTVTKSMFRDAFQSIRPENFTYEGLGALYDYLEEIDENMEFDVIAICCDFSEYETLEAITQDYQDIEDMEDLFSCTTVIEFEGGIIIQQF